MSLLSVTAATANAAIPDLDCTVTPAVDLYMRELRLRGIVGLGGPVGTVHPGTPANPVFHTIYLDATDPALRAAAPFTLSVTFDPAYKVLTLQLV